MEEKQTCLYNLRKLAQDPSINICFHLRDNDMPFFFSLKGHFVYNLRIQPYFPRNLPSGEERGAVFAGYSVYPNSFKRVPR